MKIKIFLSDSGWGPVVRQSAIVNELRKSFSNLEVVVQTNKNSKLINRFFGNVKIINSDNLIKWFHDNNGNIDEIKVSKYYKHYKNKSKHWFKNTLKIKTTIFLFQTCHQRLSN